MIAPNVKLVNLLSLLLIVPTLTFALIKRLWNLPLRNGRAYFLGVEVGPDFYEGPDCRWLSRYHAMLVTVHGIDFGALVLILAIRQWDWIPIWAGCTAVFLTGSMFAFSLWVRNRVRTVLPILPAALSLEPRRLHEYIWWPLEVACLAVIGCSWWMLMQNAQTIDWQFPLAITWAVLGLLPGKIVIVRQGWPLPADRAQEHRDAQDAARRYSIRIMDAMGCLLASILFMSALRHVWTPARTVAPVQWLTLGIPFALGVLLVIVIAGQKRVFEMGRTLRPAGSWSPSFGHATFMNRTGLTWFTIWFGGLVLLMLFTSAGK